VRAWCRPWLVALIVLGVVALAVIGYFTIEVLTGWATPAEMGQLIGSVR
jgi:hypothetical protein